LTKNKIK